MSEFTTLEVVHEVLVDAPREKVWQAFVEAKWWPAEMLVGPKATMHIEPSPGGRIYEDWGNGNGFVWSTIRSANAPVALTGDGPLTPPFGGPANISVEFTFTEESGGTRVRLLQRAWGLVDDNLKTSQEQGWKLLLTDNLKPFVEGS